MAIANTYRSTKGIRSFGFSAARFRAATPTTDHFLQRVGATSAGMLPIGAEGSAASVVTGAVTQFLSPVIATQVGTAPGGVCLGESTVVLANVTATQEGVVTGYGIVTGTGSAVLAGVGTTAAAAVLVDGSSDVALDDVGTDQSGLVVSGGAVLGQANVTLERVVPTASGEVTGNVSIVQLADVRRRAVGRTNVIIHGTALQALAGVVQTSDGKTGISLLTQAITLAGVVQQATGQARVAAASTQVLSALVQSAQGKVIARGSASVQLADVSCYGRGLEASKYRPHASQLRVFQPLTQSLSVRP